MWTFLGIASFTYVYKKYDALMSSAHVELIAAAVVGLSVGLIIACLGLRGQSLGVSHLFQLPLRLLTTFPLTQKLVSTSNTKNSDRTSKKVRYCAFSHFIFCYCVFEASVFNKITCNLSLTSLLLGLRNTRTCVIWFK